MAYILSNEIIIRLMSEARVKNWKVFFIMVVLKMLNLCFRKRENQASSVTHHGSTMAPTKKSAIAKVDQKIKFPFPQLFTPCKNDNDDCVPDGYR